MSSPFQTPKRQAKLAETFFPGILCRLHRLSFSGTVQVRNGPLTKSVYFRDGQILSAASNDDTDRLPSILLRSSLLSREQLDMALEKARPGTSLGRSLVELGFVSRQQLMETARDQVRGILESLFDWSKGDYQILENQVPPAVPNLGMKTEQLLFEALGRSSNREGILGEIGGMDQKFGPSEVPPTEWKTWNLGKEAERVLGAVNGVRTVNHIAAEVETDDFSVIKMLCGGLHLGILECREPPAVPAPSEAEPERSAQAVEPVPIDFDAEAEMPAVSAPLEPEHQIDSPRRDGMEEMETTPDTEESPPGFEPTSTPPAAETESAATEPAPLAAGESIPTGETDFARIGGSGSTVETSTDAELPPEPVAGRSVPAMSEPQPAPEFSFQGSNGNGAPEGVELQTPPEEGPFHGFVDTSKEMGRRRGTGRGGRSGTRWFAIGGILVGGALIVFAVAVWTSRGSTEPERNTDLPLDTAAVQMPASPTPDDRPEIQEEAGEAGTEPASSTGPDSGAGAPAASPDSTPTEPGAPAAAAVEAPPPPTPKTAAPQPEPTRAATTPLLEARQALAAGQFSAAAENFRSAVAASPQGYTLQLLLACKSSTIAGLMPPPEDFLLLPQRYKGRDCFRVCWGRFPNRNSALAARQQLPPELSGLSGDPFPLALSSVTAAGQTP